MRHTAFDTPRSVQGRARGFCLVRNGGRFRPYSDDDGRVPSRIILAYCSRTHFINRREMRSAQKGPWQGARRVVWRCHTQGVQRGQRPFWVEPTGSGPFGRIAVLRIWVKTSSLDPDSRLALHPKRDSLALTPIDQMSSRNPSSARDAGGASSFAGGYGGWPKTAIWSGQNPPRVNALSVLVSRVMCRARANWPPA